MGVGWVIKGGFKNLMQIQVITKMWISQEGGGGLEKVDMVFLGICYVFFCGIFYTYLMVLGLYQT